MMHLARAIAAKDDLEFELETIKLSGITEIHAKVRLHAQSFLCKLLCDFSLVT